LSIQMKIFICKVKKMNNFLDSSVIIEFAKKNPLAIKIVNDFLEKDIFFINSIIISEVVYILQNKAKVKLDYIISTLSVFEFLTINHEIIEKMYLFMQKYNLKPNDAFILATCKYYQIPNLVSLDSHFIEPCKAENINLINS